MSIDQPAPIFRGQPAMFTATVTDDQSEPAIVEWAHTDGACPPNWRDKSAWPGDRVTGSPFAVDGMVTLKPFCVWAVARDRYGASAPAIYAATPANHPPVAKLEIAAPKSPPYDFQTTFALSGAASMDQDADPLTFDWNLILTNAPGSKAQLVPCAAPFPGNIQWRCLSTDVAGDYQVELKVGDGTTTTVAVQTLTVLEDKLPCIAATAPPYKTPDLVHVLSDGDTTPEPEVFKVLQVNDDLDPFPRSDSMLHFNWSLAMGDDKLVSQGTDVPIFSLPTSGFRIGDSVHVRVEITDRNNSAEIQNVLAACAKDSCAVSTARAYRGDDGCLISVGWTVTYR